MTGREEKKYMIKITPTNDQKKKETTIKEKMYSLVFYEETQNNKALS